MHNHLLLNLFEVSFLTESFLDVKEVDFPLEGFVQICFYLVQVCFHAFLEVLQLVAYVILTVIQGLLDFFEFHFDFNVSHDFILHFQHFIYRALVHQISPDSVDFLSHLHEFLLRVALAVVDDLLDELRSLFHVLFALFLQLLELVPHEKYLVQGSLTVHLSLSESLISLVVFVLSLVGGVGLVLLDEGLAVVLELSGNGLEVVVVHLLVDGVLDRVEQRIVRFLVQ